MSKSMKKILVASASLLMITGVGASVSQSVNPVHANRASRRIASLRSRRSRDYRDIKSINAELNKLEHKRARRHRLVHHHSVTRRAHRVQLMHDISYTRGVDNANGYIAHGFLTEIPNERYYNYKGITEFYPQLTPKYINNKYKQGWIKAAYNSWNPHHNMRTVVNDYNNGIKYLNNHQSRNSETGNIYLNSNQQWFNDNEDNH